MHDDLKLLGVDKIWVKALSRTHHRILAKLGADRIIQPEHEIGQHIAQVLHNPLIRDYVSLGNGFHIVDLHVPERLDGTSLASFDLEAGYELRCLGVMRGTAFLSPQDTDLMIKTDDKLLLLGRRQNLRKFGDKI